MPTMIGLNSSLGIALTILIILGIAYQALHWLIDVRSRLSATEASNTAIREWIKGHEGMAERQAEMFNLLRITQGALETKVDDVIERLDRISERMVKWDRK